jgi:hypothetical protein
MEDQYYVRGQLLASRILAQPECANSWIPASLMCAPAPQQIGFIDRMFQSDNKDLMDQTSYFVQVARKLGDGAGCWLYKHFMSLHNL